MSFSNSAFASFSGPSAVPSLGYAGPFVGVTVGSKAAPASANGNAEVDDIMAHLNLAAAGREHAYMCKRIAWEDVDRYMTSGNGALSTVGANITDVHIEDDQKPPRCLYTLRAQNWNERVNTVAASDIMVVVGNHVPGNTKLESVPLDEVLRHMGAYGNYAGVAASINLSAPDTDAKVSVRRQVVFLPTVGVAATEPGEIGPEHVASRHFLTKCYSYQTRDPKDPRNMLLLCTAQGMAVQQSEVGAQPVPYHLKRADMGITRYKLEAEASNIAVGAEQIETPEEAAAAAKRGKATARFIGTKDLAARFDIQMLVQVPLKQKPVETKAYGGYATQDKFWASWNNPLGGKATMSATSNSSPGSTNSSASSQMYDLFGSTGAKVNGVAGNTLCFGESLDGLQYKSADLSASAPAADRPLYVVPAKRDTTMAPSFSKPGCAGCKLNSTGSSARDLVRSSNASTAIQDMQDQSAQTQPLYGKAPTPAQLAKMKAVEEKKCAKAAGALGGQHSYGHKSSYSGNSNAPSFVQPAQQHYGSAAPSFGAFLSSSPFGAPKKNHFEKGVVQYQKTAAPGGAGASTEPFFADFDPPKDVQLQSSALPGTACTSVFGAPSAASAHGFSASAFGAPTTATFDGATTGGFCGAMSTGGFGGGAPTTGLFGSAGVSAASTGFGFGLGSASFGGAPGGPAPPQVDRPAPKVELPAPKIGVSNAARVSYGGEYDRTWPGVANRAPVRNPDEHITVTITMFCTVQGGVPSMEDACAAMDDLDRQYAAWPSSARADAPAFLSDPTAPKKPSTPPIVFDV